MNRQNSMRLFKRFPFFYPQKKLTESLMGFGFECGDGWFDLLWDLCLQIEKKGQGKSWYHGVKYKWYEYPKKIWEFFIAIRFFWWYKTPQFLLKFLRDIFSKSFYNEWRYPPFEVIQVKEKFGGLRFYPNSAPKSVWNLIDIAEEKSYEICEECGKKGTLRKGGWWATLCDKHAKERNLK